ncbi:golgin subfamily A member 3-like isoform X1 [Acipenser oxyrinchus oxyrinchus]|uniref:Golgin subfamily A member 3-like isoform X1 n=1 Tax=Acipenser oxyrinchus oxyrinchus TaxID=40147 RepID=A0AAD8FWP0_ACIOX|nr:golgin subfamily A member 3-like isoform X1 [Acipenser oxyrinchus oxyrinchus]
METVSDQQDCVGSSDGNSECLSESGMQEDTPTVRDGLNGSAFNPNKVANADKALAAMGSGGEGDITPNGPLSQLQESPQSQEPSSGVAAFHHNLTKSQGANSEGTVHNGDTLQSLKLSLPMQETELCSTEPSMELENEEQIRLQARRRLEEQLKQYRVQKHQHRSHHSTPKNRLSSTLDPELMLHPDALPRANTTSMTTEYSFMRTSVPRGPKLGSLGIPPPAKEKKRSSKSSGSSRIRSLADYKELGAGSSSSSSSARSQAAGHSTQGSLHSSRSSTSVVSEVSLASETEERLETSLQMRDSVSELDGSESGVRQDGNESDSSSYSSASVAGGGFSMLSSEGSRQRDWGEIAPEAVGQYPSLQEVLQAATDELHLLAQEQEMNGARSRRDSISSSVSLGSSVIGSHDEMLQVLKEKMRLEGQLESLSAEASQALKEKTELQAKLASVNAQLQAQLEQNQASQQTQSNLTLEVGNLRQNCSELERAMSELQGSLEAKNGSLASLSNDLQVAEEQYQRLLGKVEEMQQSISSRDNTVQQLRQQMGALQAQLLQVQSERSTLVSRLKTLQSEISSLQHVRQWYQQQLTLAQEARVRLQSEMANIQAGQMTQTGVLEHLKLENVTLSHELTETQQRSIKEKERIAVQLQNIEADMLDQDAAYRQIQEAKSMVEEDLHHKLEELEEERDVLQRLASSASTVERELEQVKLALTQKDLQLEAVQQEHLDLMKQLTLAQEALHTKEQSLSGLQARYEELEAQLSELQGLAGAQDHTIQSLQNDKIVLEVALQAARAEQEGLDEGARRLGEGAEAALEILEQLRQEVKVKATQIEGMQHENSSLKKQTQKLKEQYLQQKVMVEAYRRDASSKDQLISELKATKKRLNSEVKGLKQELLNAQGERKCAELEQSRLGKEVARVQQQMTSLQTHLESAQRERDQLELQLQSVQFDQGQLATVTEENAELRKQVEQMQQEAKKAISEQKVRMKRLGTDLTSAQKDMKVKHKAYENAVGILSRRLQEALTAKETAEAELSKLKAQVTDGGSSQALQDKIEALQTELQTVTHSKAMLEKELQEVISLTSQELEEYQEKVLELEDELQESRGFKKRIRRLEEHNKKLSLELEHERGKLAGLGQSHTALREHANILETALARREADLMQLNLQVQAVLKRKEQEDQQMKELVQRLQAALEKEKASVGDLKQQVAAVKAEAAHNRRHYRAAALELSEVKKELQAKEQLFRVLQTEADKLQAQDERHSQEVTLFQQELGEANSQLQLLQKQLEEQQSNQPVTNQEVEDLKWEVEQKEREIEAQKQQLEMTEQRSHKELEGFQASLQGIKAELEVVQEELTGTRKDKFMLQAKVVELRNSMKTLLQQNQQLKLELKQSRNRKRMELKGDTNMSNPVTPVKIPDCPVPASLLEELLKPPTSVSKEPLSNLHHCLRQLKQEMDSLQKQMEEHTVTVHESMTSWTNMEGQLMGLPAASSLTAGDEQSESESTPGVELNHDGCAREEAAQQS